MDNDDIGARAHREGDEAEERRDVADERLGHEHPSAPEQVHHGFDEGFHRGPHTPEEEAEESAEPNFARGVADETRPESHHRGRFSEGVEEFPDSPEDNIERRFSEGIEESPTSD